MSTSASPNEAAGATGAVAARAASYPQGVCVGRPVSTAPRDCFQAANPPASTATPLRPMRLSQAAVMADRAKPSQINTIEAALTAMYSSVAWTSWPPGAHTAPATCPAAYSSAVRTSKRQTFSASRRSHRWRTSSGARKGTPSSAATRLAAIEASVRLFADTGGAQRAAPRSSSSPARAQPIVPLRTATMGFGSLMRRSDSAPR